MSVKELRLPPGLPPLPLLLLLPLMAAAAPVSAASFEIQGVAPVAAVRGTSPPEMAVTFSVTEPGTTQSWTASLEGSPAWAGFSGTVGSGESGAGNLTVSFNTEALAPGSYDSAVVLNSGGTVSRKAFTLTVIKPDVIRMKADFGRPVIYALHRDEAGPDHTSHVIFLNTETEKVEKVLSAGSDAQDFDISYPEQTLYVINQGSPAATVRAIDLNTRRELRAMALDMPDNRVSASVKGRIVTANNFMLSLRDSADGTRKRGTSLRAGDGETDPSGQYYYHCTDAADWSGPKITRYDLLGSDLEQVITSEIRPYGTAALLMSADGSRVFWKTSLFDSGLKELRTFGGDITACTLRGEFVIGTGNAWNGTTGANVRTLPLSSPVAVVSGDQKKVFQFDAEAGAFVMTPMSSIGAVPPVTNDPAPAVNAVVWASLPKLSWTRTPGAAGYRIFLGTDQAAVAAAGTDSPLYLGETDNPEKILTSPLAAGTEFFWRVDAVKPSGVTAGPVWKFRTSALTIQPDALTLKLPYGTPALTYPLNTGAAAAGSWTASESASWLSLPSATGTAGSPVQVKVDTTGLQIGKQSASLNLTFAGQTLAVPVTLDVFLLKLLKMMPDPARPWVYGLHQGDYQAPAGYVACISTASRQVEDVIDVGTGVADFCINRQEGRMYVAGTGPNRVQVIDLETRKVLSTFPCALPPVKISAGRAGRIYVEGEDGQLMRTAWIMDSATGAVMATAPGLQRYDVRMDPSGRFYYRADTLYPNGPVHRYDVSQDTWTTPRETRVTSLSPFGGDLIMSQDGSRLFLRGVVCDPDFNNLRDLSSPIYASSQRGELAVTVTGLVNTRTGVNVAPVSLAKICAFTGDQSALLYYTEDWGRILSLPLTGAAAVPAPGTVTQPADQSVNLLPVPALSWDASPAAVKYRVYFGADAAAVAAATSASPLYLGETFDISWPFPQGAITAGGSYFWRVDVVGLSSVTPGAVKSFKTLAVTTSPLQLSHTAPAGAPPDRFLLPVSGTAGTSWTASTSGAPWLKVITPSGTVDHTLEVEISSADLVPGYYSGTVALTANGISASIPVELNVVPLNLSALLADPVRPRLYAFQHSAPGLDSLLVFDTGTSKIIRKVPLSADPTAMDLAMDQRFLYVYNEEIGRIQRFDPEDWTSTARVVVPVTNLSLPASRRRLAGAEGARVYWVDRQTGNLRGLDYNTGEAVGPGVVVTAPGMAFGGIATLPGGGQLAAFGDGGAAARVNLDGVLPSAAVIGAGTGSSSAQAPVLPRADASAVFMGSHKLDFSLTKVLKVFPAEIQAVTRNAGVVFGKTQAWRESSGAVVWTAPDKVHADVCAVAGDQSAFFYFNKLTASLTRVPFSEIGGLPSSQPDDGEVLDAMPSRLSWAPNPEAVGYQIYFGLDQVGVENASGAAGTYHLGNSTEPSIALNQEFAAGGIRWWRVDTVLPSGTVKGAVRKFSGALAPVARLAADAASSGNLFISPVVMDGRTLMAGYPYAGGTTTGGKVRVYRKTPGREEWALIQVLSSPGTQPELSGFGTAVALKGDTAWISAPRDVKVYEFRRDSLTGLWAATGRKAEPSSPAASSAYGFGKTLAFNGLTLAVGVPDATIGNAPSGGAVDVFDASTLARQRLLELTPWTFAYYGTDLVLGDGFLAVGSPDRPKTGSAFTGAVDLWTQAAAGGAWSRSSTLTPAAADNVKKLGSALAVSGDRLFVGTASADSQVFVYQKTGSSWSRTAKLPGRGDSATFFADTAMAASGDLMAFGLAGNVWLNRRTADQVWTPAAPARPEPLETLPGLGNRLALSPRYLAATYNSASGPSGRIPDGVTVFLADPDGNIPPVLVSAPAAAAQTGKPWRSVFTALDENAGEALKFTAVSALPAWASLTDHGDGTAELSGTPPAEGTVSLDIQVTDSAGTSDHQKFDLRILPGTEYPAILTQSTDQTAEDGQPVTLSVSVANSAATFQWLRDGTALSGETKAGLTLAHAQASDAGSYQVRVTLGTAVVESGPIRVTVHDVPNKFGGDWTTFGANASRTGAYPATLGRHKFLPGLFQLKTASQPVITGGGRIYAVIKEGASEPVFTAWDPDTGARLWLMRHSGQRINPPTWHNGRIYVQRSTDSSGPGNLLCLDAATGRELWNTPYQEQSSTYLAPAVDDSGIYICSGSYSGLSGFDLTGRLRFFREQLPQVDQWTPMLHDGKLYSWVRGGFRNHDPLTGLVNYRITTGETDSPGRLPAAEGNLAVMGNPQMLYGMDLSGPGHTWKRSGTFTGSPAVKNGVAYIIGPDGVESYNLKTGQPGVKYPTHIQSGLAIQAIHQPVILDDTLLVSSWDTTWTFDLATGAPLQMFSGGGPLTYANGLLMAAGSDLTLRTWKVNQPAVLRPGQEGALTAMSGEPLVWDLKITDPDGDTPIVTFAGLPAWLTAAPLSQGVVRFTGTPSAANAGPFAFTVTADDAKSFASTLRIEGAVSNSPLGITTTGGLVFNPQTVLWEQTVSVKNQTGQVMSGFDLSVTGLPAGVRLYNRSGGSLLSPVAGYHRPLAAGASVTLILEYQASSGASLTPSLSATEAGPETAPAPAAGAPFTISRAVMAEPGVLILEFPAEPGTLYQVQYRDDGGGPWNNSLSRLRAAGTSVQWTDTGTPATSGPPGSVKSRFYRVQRLPGS